MNRAPPTSNSALHNERLCIVRLRNISYITRPVWSDINTPRSLLIKDEIAEFSNHVSDALMS